MLLDNGNMKIFTVVLLQEYYYTKVEFPRCRLARLRPLCVQTVEVAAVVESHSVLLLVVNLMLPTDGSISTMFPHISH